MLSHWLHSLREDTVTVFYFDQSYTKHIHRHNGIASDIYRVAWNSLQVENLQGMRKEMEKYNVLIVINSVCVWAVR